MEEVDTNIELLNTGKAAIPELGVTVLGVVSPRKTDSVFENADPAVVTVVAVSTNAGTPLVKEPKFNPPILPLVVVSPTVTEGVMLLPERL